MLGFDEGIKSGLSDGKFLGTIFGYVDGITLRHDFVTVLGSLDGSIYGYDDGKL